MPRPRSSRLMEKTPKLSVEDSVRAVVHAKLHEDPARKLSISEICREAHVSRATLYANHRALVDELFPLANRIRERTEASAASREEAAKKLLKLENQALLYLCIELQLEVRSLRARLQQYPKRKI